MIITEYRRQLGESDLVDSDTILERTIDHLNHSGTSSLGTVFVYGFHDLLPLEQDLFDAVRDLTEKVHFYVPDGIDPNIFKSRAAEGNQSGSQPVLDPSSLQSQITGLFSESRILKSGDFSGTVISFTLYGSIQYRSRDQPVEWPRDSSFRYCRCFSRSSR